MRSHVLWLLIPPLDNGDLKALVSQCKQCSAILARGTTGEATGIDQGMFDLDHKVLDGS